MKHTYSHMYAPVYPMYKPYNYWDTKTVNEGKYSLIKSMTEYRNTMLIFSWRRKQDKNIFFADNFTDNALVITETTVISIF